MVKQLMYPHLGVSQQTPQGSLLHGPNPVLGMDLYIWTGLKEERMIIPPQWLFCVVVTSLSLSLAFPQSLWAKGDDLKVLQKNLDAQQELILKQGELLKKQQQTNERQLQEIQQLKKRLDRLEAKPAHPSSPPSLPLTPEPPPTKAAKVSKDPDAIQASDITRGRDSVGDLNAASVQEGSFPGSIQIPGPGQVSLAIGGFIKTVAIYDTNAEDAGADFLPALLGVRRDDKSGNFAVDATMTRYYLDARAPVRYGHIRGYLELDLNDNNDGSLDQKVRHAYGVWKSPWGTLTAGQTWSTLMDLRALPEGLTEPTISGAIFQRQALLRWTQPLDLGASVDFAIEDPDSNDVFRDQEEFSNSAIPDVVLAGEIVDEDIGHVRVGGIYRRIKVDKDGGGGNTKENGWGITGGLHVNTVGKDRVMLVGSYGKGLGRYLLGIAPAAGGWVDPASGDLKLRTNYGGYVAYQRFWDQRFHSNFGLGHARAKTLSGQPGNFFHHSTYAYGNLMWNVLPYLTFGIEYDYGQRENRDNSTKDNHRIMIGTQLF